MITALHKGGVRVGWKCNISTIRDPDAIAKTCGAIRMIREEFPDMKVGSGTVTCVEHVIATKEAGGEFVVTECKY